MPTQSKKTRTPRTPGQPGIMPEFRITDLIKQPLRRSFVLDRKAIKIDKEARTVEMSISSDAPIEQWFSTFLVLEHTKKAVDLKRMRQAAPFLVNHSVNDHVGVHESVDLDTNKLRAVIRFGTGVRASEIFDDVCTGIRPNVSIGFMVHKTVLISRDEKTGVEYHKATSWEPFETSSASVAADISVGVGRNAEWFPVDATETARSETSEADEPGETDGITLEVEVLDSDEITDEVTETGNDVITLSETVTRQTKAIEVRTMALKQKRAAGAGTAVEDLDEIEEIEETEADVMTPADRAEIARAAAVMSMADLLGGSDTAALARARTLAQSVIANEGGLKEFREQYKALIARTQTGVVPGSPAVIAGGITGAELAQVNIPHRSMANFPNTPQGRETAWRFGQFLHATRGNGKARQYCKDHSIPLVRSVENRASDPHTESDNEHGGITVPVEFDPNMIDLRHKYGIFKQYANVVPMASETKRRPRRKGGLLAYPIGANGTSRALTLSKKGWNMVGLSAKKWGVLTQYEQEFSDDSILNVSDDLIGEISYAFEKQADLNGFLGDGTSNYHGIIGLASRLSNPDGSSPAVTSCSSLVVASGNLWSEVLLLDFLKMIARLPDFAEGEEVRWYCHRSFWAQVMCAISLSAGGNTANEIENMRRKIFLGYEVVTSEVLPKSQSNSSIPCYLGNLRQGVMYGDRAGNTIAMTDSHDDTFAEDIWTIRGTTRYDINVHEAGNVTAVEADFEPGPVIGLILAAS